MTVYKKTVCYICGLDKHLLAKFCKRCKKILDRIDTRRKHDRAARIKALKSSWDGSCFRCNYSGVKLEEKDHKSPLYITFDHRIPRKEDDIVIAASVINDMKSDLDEEEFKNVINHLAEYFRNGVLINPDVFNLKHWKR
ncbi:MAG: hypothetical protein PHV48_01455 [Candidatus Omnitrophica bacterium]|nr:hypothetical protein [Candidatus Omnitrophota bacterium]